MNESQITVTRNHFWKKALDLKNDSSISAEEKVEMLTNMVLVMDYNREEIVLENQFIVEDVIDRIRERERVRFYKILLQLVLRMIKFPYSTICKHFVSLTILNTLEQDLEYDLVENHKDLIKLIGDCDDEGAIRKLNQLIEDTIC